MNTDGITAKAAGSRRNSMVREEHMSEATYPAKIVVSKGKQVRKASEHAAPGVAGASVEAPFVT